MNIRESEINIKATADMSEANNEIEKTKDKAEDALDSITELQSVASELRPMFTIRNPKDCHFSITINKGD